MSPKSKIYTGKDAKPFKRSSLKHLVHRNQDTENENWVRSFYSDLTNPSGDKMWSKQRWALAWMHASITDANTALFWAP